MDLQLSNHCRLIVCLALALLQPVGATAQTRTLAWRSVADHVDRSAPALLQQEQVPGLALGLVQDGEVLWTRGFGFADLETRRRVTPDTVFNAGSISKTATAWAVMKLVESGALTLDEPVFRRLRRWAPRPVSFPLSGVTARRILSHTAGLSFCCYYGFAVGEPLPSIIESLSGQDLLWEDEPRRGESVRIIAAPGTKWIYSGGGYAVAQALVEDISGTGYDEFMRREVFAPLGMKSSGFNWPEHALTNAATPYRDADGRSETYRQFPAAAAAGLHTTIDDLARFLAAHTLSGKTGVLAPATLGLMMEPAPASVAIRNGGRLGFEIGYGLGYMVLEMPDGSRVVGHTGSNLGWTASIWLSPACRCGIAALSNGTNGRHVAQRWPLQLLERWQRFESRL